MLRFLSTKDSEFLSLFPLLGRFAGNLLESQHVEDLVWELGLPVSQEPTICLREEISLVVGFEDEEELKEGDLASKPLLEP